MMTDQTPEKKATASVKKAAPATATKPKPATQPTAKPAPRVAAKPATAKVPGAPLAKKPSVPAPKPAPKPAAKTAPATAAPSLTIVAPIAKSAAPKAAQLKMKDLIERVVKASGGKKKGVKEIVEATLATLGDALAKGEAINLPGFGRAKVAHAEDKGAGKPMTIKMKSQPAAEAKKPKKLPLAATED
jgi:nucleoid DNA-binding protein